MSAIVLPNSMTSTTTPPSFVNTGICFGKFMPSFAMGQCFLFCATSLSTKNKTLFINFASFIYKLIKSFCGFSPLNNGVPFKIIFFRNFANKVFNSFNSYISSNSSVSLLFFFSRPFAVIWAVIAIIVNSINRITLRSFTHIFNKLVKIINPIIANFYASTAIVCIMFVGWIT